MPQQQTHCCAHTSSDLPILFCSFMCVTCTICSRHFDLFCSIKYFAQASSSLLACCSEAQITCCNLVLVRCPDMARVVLEPLPFFLPNPAQCFNGPHTWSGTEVCQTSKHLSDNKTKNRTCFGQLVGYNLDKLWICSGAGLGAGSANLKVQGPRQTWNGQEDCREASKELQNMTIIQQ